MLSKIIKYQIVSFKPHKTKSNKTKRNRVVIEVTNSKKKTKHIIAYLQSKVDFDRRLRRKKGGK